MQVLYGSADQVRLAAAESLGFVRGDDATDGDARSADANSRSVRKSSPAAPLPVPTMPNESAVLAAEDRLASISQSVIAEETERAS